MGYDFFQEVAQILTLLEMPVNITQYRGSVGIFSNRNFGFRAKFTNGIGHKRWSTNHLYFKQYLPIFSLSLTFFFAFVIVVLSTKCSFYISSRNTSTSMLVITVALLFNYLWFKCNILLICGHVELNPDPTQNTAKKFSYATGTLIA